MKAYSALMRLPSVGRIVAIAAISRVTTSMLSLSLLLAVVSNNGAYRAGGSVLFGHALALAILAPLSGRIADRIGRRSVLLIFIFLHVLAYAGLLVALHSGAPAVVTVLCATALGATTPPAAAVTRRTWPLLVPEESLRTAYALNSVINSTTFILGPLIVGLLVLFVPALFVVAIGAVAKIGGDLLLATASIAEIPGTSADRKSGIFGPLANPQLVLLLGTIALDTFVIGVMQVGAVAATNASSMGGFLLSASAAGEVAGGLIYGVVSWQLELRWQLIWLHIGTAAIVATMGLVPGLAFLLLLYSAAGLTSGMRDALGQHAVGGLAPAGAGTEAFGWMTSFMWAGYGLGTFASGLINSAFGVTELFYVAAAVSAAAAALAWFVRRPK